ATDGRRIVDEEAGKGIGESAIGQRRGVGVRQREGERRVAPGVERGRAERLGDGRLLHHRQRGRVAGRACVDAAERGEGGGGVGEAAGGGGRDVDGDGAGAVGGERSVLQRDARVSRGLVGGVAGVPQGAAARVGGVQRRGHRHTGRE